MEGRLNKGKEVVREGLCDLNAASRRSDENSDIRLHEAAEWLRTVVDPLGMPANPSHREFVSSLRNGTILCHAINMIQPGAVPTIVASDSHIQSNRGSFQHLFQFFENVNNFLKAAKELNLPIFEASDLELDNMDANSVGRIVDCVLKIKNATSNLIIAKQMGSDKNQPATSYSDRGMGNFNRLPEDLVLQILSCLPFEDVLHTTVLSKAWRYLYSSVPGMNVRLLDKDKLSEAMNSLDRLFFYRSRCTFESFALSCDLRFPSWRLQGWMHALMYNNIKRIQVFTMNTIFTEGSLPAALFTCRSLVMLCLAAPAFRSAGVLDLPMNINLPRLEELSLTNVCFSVGGEETGQRLFSSCPLLDSLTIIRKGWENRRYRFVVSNSNLKQLFVECFVCEEEPDAMKFEIEIHAPRLLLFEIKMRNVSFCLRLGAQALVEARISYDVCPEHQDQLNFKKWLADLLTAVRNIERLQIDGKTLMNIVEQNVAVPLLPNMNFLRLISDSNSHHINQLPYLLESSQVLEELVLRGWTAGFNSNMWEESMAGGCWLTTVKVIRVQLFHGSNEECEMVLYFLIHAQALNELHIGLDLAGNEERLEKVLEILMWPSVFVRAVQIFIEEVSE